MSAEHPQLSHVRSPRRDGEGEGDTHRFSLRPFEPALHGRVIPGGGGESAHIETGFFVDIQIVVRGVLVGGEAIQVDVLFAEITLLLGNLGLIFLGM
jgi:hypothetical protein